MTDQKHDSLAPKGAFTTTDAADTERAAASTASLVATQPDQETVAAADNEPLVTVTLAAGDEDELCADELIPGGERVSMENAMRTLIEMRLEQSRPSDDFGAFELAPTASASEPRRDAQPTTYQPTMNSLAPIELAAATPASAEAGSERKASPFPYLAAAAVVLFGIGLYRRLDQAGAAPAPSAHAAALDSATSPLNEGLANAPAHPEPEEAFVAQEITPLSVSESDDAILTLGTPTIVYVPEDAVEVQEDTVEEEDRASQTEAAAPPTTRAAKESKRAAESVARPVRAATRNPTRELPTAPSREDIVAGFNSVRAEVLACANGAGGVAPIEATVIGSGRITHANVGGYYQGTPAGSCIARVLRKARFAEFSGESIKVSFPYTL